MAKNRNGTFDGSRQVDRVRSAAHASRRWIYGLPVGEAAREQADTLVRAAELIKKYPDFRSAIDGFFRTLEMETTMEAGVERAGEARPPLGR